MALFELDWLGGTAERLFHEHRGDRLESIPWAEGSVSSLTDAERDGLRIVWTQSAYQEWCAAAAFAALLRQLLRARAPVDLIGMAGSFVADEMVHVELASRMANRYGGGVPLEVDPGAVEPLVSEGVDELLAACELGIRVSCVGESFSLPILAQELSVAPDPVSRAVLQRIVADEASHAKVGWLILDWALPRVGKAGLEQLTEVARDAVDALIPALSEAPSQARFFEQIFATRVAGPLGRRGISVQEQLFQTAS